MAFKPNHKILINLNINDNRIASDAQVSKYVNNHVRKQVNYYLKNSKIGGFRNDKR